VEKGGSDGKGKNKIKEQGMKVKKETNKTLVWDNKRSYEMTLNPHINRYA
jgi:hypothetical protein